MIFLTLNPFEMLFPCTNLKMALGDAEVYLGEAHDGEAALGTDFC